MTLETNLVRMLGAPETVKCPECGETVATFFDAFDLDAGDPNPDDGVWHLEVCCHECDNVWTLKFSVKLVAFDDEEEQSHPRNAVIIDGVEYNFVKDIGATADDLALQLRAQGLDAFVTPEGAISWRPPEAKSNVVVAKACGVPRESGKPAAVVDGKQVCPECGAPAESGYGLMGGGVGVYAFCTSDSCDWFWKMQDDDEG
jgi:hypothetical protein